MAAENWQQVRDIFDVALRQKPEERTSFVNEVCGGDKTLLTEVESLLTSLDSAESFMETPAIAKVAEQVLTEQRQFSNGQYLNHYKIVRPIGTGGMGEVYLATDTKLNRQVALKVLHPNLFSDNQANRRLVREAQAAGTVAVGIRLAGGLPPWASLPKDLRSLAKAAKRDLAAEERRRTGREEQPAYFTRHQDESSQRPGHELERPVWQHAGQRPAGGAYPQVMTGAAAVVSVADPGGRSSSDSSDAAMPDRTDEAATPPVWARGRVEVAPPSAPATDVRPIEPATVPASSKSWTPDSVGEIHHEAHATGFGSYSADGVPAPVELAPVAMIEPAAQPEPQPEPKATAKS